MSFLALTSEIVTPTEAPNLDLNPFANAPFASVDEFGDFMYEKALPVAIRLVIAILFIIVCKRLIKFVVSLVSKGLEKSKLDDGVSGFIESIAKFGLYALMIVGIFEILGIGTTTIVTLLGSIGLTIGLALQGSLSNFAGGMLILILKPFKVGDYIIACGEEGTVVSIDIFYTKLRTGDFRDVVIPNGSLSNSGIVNVSGESKRRIDFPIGVSYGTDIDKAKEALTNLAENCEFVLKEEGITVFVNQYASNSIDFILRVWVAGANYWPAKFEINEKIKKVLDENGIEIPFNQLDVNLKK